MSDATAKAGFVEAYFDRWGDDVDRAKTLLLTQEYYREAILVLSCHIGALASLRFPALADGAHCGSCLSGSTFTKRSSSKIGTLFRPDDRRTRLHHWSSKMIPRVDEAHYVRGFTIHLRFSDGTEGHVDLGEELHGEVFEPLKDQALFRQFSVHPEFHTLCWPNGADLAPEFLYEKVQVPA